MKSSKKITKTKKIIIFSGYFLPHLGGVERYVDKLSIALKDLGYEIVIVTSNDAELPNIEVKEGYIIYRLPIRKIFKKRYPIPFRNNEFKSLIKKIEEEKPDHCIINTRFHLTSLVGAKMAKRLNIPILVIEHGSDHFTVNNKVLDFFGRIYEHLLTGVIKKYTNKFYGVSNRCNQWLKHFSINATGIFYNSIDAKAYDVFANKKKKPNYNGKIVISFAGRIIKEKGVVMLLDVFEKLNQKYKDIVLVIAGDGPILNQLKEQHKSENIFFEGKLSYENVMSLYNDTDIFVHPSMFPEGLPTAILEAGLMKCAIIATDRGGTVEVINNEKYGLICEENADSLQGKLEYLLDNPKNIDILKNNIHERVMVDFSWGATAKTVGKELEEK